MRSQHQGQTWFDPFFRLRAQTLDKAKLDQFLDRLAEKKKAMGSLAIAKDGKILYTRAIGYSRINGTEKKPLTTENRFRIGSITKMFTATIRASGNAPEPGTDLVRCGV